MARRTGYRYIEAAGVMGVVPAPTHLSLAQAAELASLPPAEQAELAEAVSRMSAREARAFVGERKRSPQVVRDDERARVTELIRLADEIRELDSRSNEARDGLVRFARDVYYIGVERKGQRLRGTEALRYYLQEFDESYPEWRSAVSWQVICELLHLEPDRFREALPYAHPWSRPGQRMLDLWCANDLGVSYSLIERLRVRQNLRRFARPRVPLEVWDCDEEDEEVRRWPETELAKAARRWHGGIGVHYRPQKGAGT